MEKTDFNDISHLVSGNQAVVHPLAVFKVGPDAGHHVRVHLHQVKPKEFNKGIKDFFERVKRSSSSISPSGWPAIVHHDAHALPRRSVENQNKGGVAYQSVILHGVAHPRVGVGHRRLPPCHVHLTSSVCVCVGNHRVDCFREVKCVPRDTIKQCGHVPLLVPAHLSQRLRCQGTRALHPSRTILELANLDEDDLYWEDQLNGFTMYIIWIW